MSRNKKLEACMCKLVQNDRRATVQKMTKRLQFLLVHVRPFQVKVVE